MVESNEELDQKQEEGSNNKTVLTREPSKQMHNVSHSDNNQDQINRKKGGSPSNTKLSSECQALN